MTAAVLPDGAPDPPDVRTLGAERITLHPDALVYDVEQPPRRQVCTMRNPGGRRHAPRSCEGPCRPAGRGTRCCRPATARERRRNCVLVERGRWPKERQRRRYRRWRPESTPMTRKRVPPVAAPTAASTHSGCVSYIIAPISGNRRTNLTGWSSAENRSPSTR